jgi:hypothetical protein
MAQNGVLFKKIFLGREISFLPAKHVFRGFGAVPMEG